LLRDPVDISSDFHEFSNTYFLADRLAAFDPAKGEGSVLWRRNELVPRIAFDNMEAVLRTFGGVTFPEGEYAVDPGRKTQTAPSLLVAVESALHGQAEVQLKS
jgi:alpha-D-xyloside xylohydrolase